MRRIITTAIASSLLALAITAAAAANEPAQHEAAHHAGIQHHRRHHRRAHTVLFSHASVKTVPGTSTPVAPTPTPVEPAGTIFSFEGGVLKITLADGSMVSGKVTERTEIRCVGAQDQAFGDDRDHGEADNRGDDGQGNSGDDGDSRGGPGPGGDFSGHGDDENGGEMGEATCDASTLTPGAKVAAAELAVSSAGSVWEQLDIVQ